MLSKYLQLPSLSFSLSPLRNSSVVICDPRLLRRTRDREKQFFSPLSFLPFETPRRLRRSIFVPFCLLNLEEVAGLDIVAPPEYTFTFRPFQPRLERNLVLEFDYLLNLTPNLAVNCVKLGISRSFQRGEI